jgi:hypothetical protein
MQKDHKNTQGISSLEESRLVYVRELIVLEYWKKEAADLVCIVSKARSQISE